MLALATNNGKTSASKITKSFSSGAASMSQFIFSEYIKENLFQKSEVTFQLRYQDENERLEGSDHIVLVDSSISSIDDLGHLDIPKWEIFSARCKNLKQDVSKNAFLFTHDIGDMTANTISIARTPLEMYQMLDLGKRLAENHKTAKALTVNMVNKNGKQIIEPSMFEALLSGLQINKLLMPSFKKSEKKQDEVESKPIMLEFVVPTPLKEAVPNSMDRNALHAKLASAIHVNEGIDENIIAASQYLFFNFNIYNLLVCIFVVF